MAEVARDASGVRARGATMGAAGRCMGWEHPPPWASLLPAIRFVSVASVTVKDIQFEPQFAGVWDVAVTAPA